MCNLDRYRRHFLGRKLGSITGFKPKPIFPLIFLYAAVLSNQRQTAHGYGRKAMFLLGSVHNTAEKFEDAALFLQLGLMSILIRHHNGTFRRRSSNRRNLKKLAFRFRTFWKRWCHDNHDNHLIFFSHLCYTNPKWWVIVAFKDHSGVEWTENILCVFRVKAPFSNSSGVVLNI